MKGFINEEDLRNLAEELKEHFSEDDIQIIMRKLDPKTTGKISLTAFIDFNREKIVWSHYYTQFETDVKNNHWGLSINS